MIFSIQPPPATDSLKFTLVLEPLAAGGVAASIMEFPRCRVEAETREGAIDQIQTNVATMLQSLELLSLEIPNFYANHGKSVWLKYAGIFEGDSDFAEISAAIRAERDMEDETDVDPSVYALED